DEPTSRDEPVPPVAPAPPIDEGWLRKPLRGAGGCGISHWTAQTPPPFNSCYFQRLAQGEAMSAQFLALPGETRLLGIARQMIGLKEVFAAPFAWCGAI